VKDLLQEIDIHDTDYAPAGDMFEFGAQVQVVRKGVFFPARARKLHELYRTHNSLDELPADVRELLEKRYFQRGFDQVWAETEEYFRQRDPEQLTRAATDPRHRMALAFRWYFGHSQRAAMTGDTALKLDFQIHCGPCLGAFNQWVQDTPLRSWRERHIEELAQRIMRGAWDLLAAGPGCGRGEG
jgi:trans-AT polyketide synthase, acyltransferase and oxidoreductase domains